METKNTYTIKQLLEVAKENQYKFACLYDNKDVKLNNYNTHQTPITKQIALIETRLKNPIISDGVYFVGMMMKYGSGQVVDKYPIIKGKATLNENMTYQIIQPPSKSENVLSYESALEMNKQLSKLENANFFLNEQNKLLQDKINSLQAELKETETSLSEYEVDGVPKTSSGMALAEKAQGWLKDIVPMLSPLADRYFDLQEKKIGLEEKKVIAKKEVKEVKQEQKKIEVGSKAFLDHIRKLHEEDEEEELNTCLDLLEQHFPEQYMQLCEELDLFEEEEEEEEKK